MGQFHYSNNKSQRDALFLKLMLPLILVQSQIKNYARQRETCKDTWVRISLVYYTLVHCERVNFKVTGINFMTVFITRREVACFRSGYNYNAALSPWEQYIPCPFRHASVRQLLSLRRVEAVKLAQAGLEDFLAGRTLVWAGWRGSVTVIRRCIVLVKFVTVPDTNSLIVNITV